MTPVSGVLKRIVDDGGEILEEVGLKVAKEAIDFARHAGRKTVKARDIKIAAEKMLEKVLGR